MKGSDAKRLKELEKENQRLKRLAPSAPCRPIFSCPSLCPPLILGSRREEGATGEAPIFEVMANTPSIPTIRPAEVYGESRPWLIHMADRCGGWATKP